MDEYYLYERVNEQEIMNIFQLTENSEMRLLRKACLDYMATDFKRFAKLVNTDQLEHWHLEEVKKRKKEMKKEQVSEEKSRKKLEKTMKKMQKKNLRLSGHVNTSVLAIAARKALAMEESSDAFENWEATVVPTPQSFFSKREPLESRPSKPKLVRRNSAKW